MSNTYRSVQSHREKRRKPGLTARLRAAKRSKQQRADLKVYHAVDVRDDFRSRISGLGGIIHRHHIVYRSRGGKTTVENVITVTEAEHAEIHAGILRLSGNANLTGGVIVYRCVPGDTWRYVFNI